MAETYAQEINDQLDKIQADAEISGPARGFRSAVLFLMRKQLMMLFDIRYHLRELLERDNGQMGG